MMKRRIPSETDFSLFSLEFLSKIAFSLVATRRAMLEKIQTVMVVSMEVWDLVQETLKARGF